MLKKEESQIYETSSEGSEDDESAPVTAPKMKVGSAEVVPKKKTLAVTQKLPAITSKSTKTVAPTAITSKMEKRNSSLATTSKGDSEDPKSSGTGRTKSQIRPVIKPNIPTGK